MADEPADKLVDFLEEYLLRPAMAAVPEHYDPDQRELLLEVQTTMRAKLGSYRACEDVGQVMRLYRAEESSTAGRELQRRLRVLNLPTLAYVRPEFEALAAKLGTTGSRS